VSLRVCLDWVLKENTDCRVEPVRPNCLLQTSSPTNFVTYLGQIYGPAIFNVTYVLEW
jgi:hypothetical protein